MGRARRQEAAAVGRRTLHLDVGADDLAAGTARAPAEGATLAEHQPQDDVRVPPDPSGHPFCLWTEA
ncbi:VOC family protein [Streptomyces sp. NPDC093094]|uniref:VOC family protein n=1 Tax=Streptomyces sp. NPDC093094 TaxID=3366026 RepID=UPI0037F6258D